MVGTHSPRGNTKIFTATSHLTLGTHHAYDNAMTNGRPKFTVRLQEHERDEITAAAASVGTTAVDLVRDLLAQWMGTPGATPPPQAPPGGIRCRRKADTTCRWHPDTPDTPNGPQPAKGTLVARQHRAVSEVQSMTSLDDAAAAAARALERMEPHGTVATGEPVPLPEAQARASRRYAAVMRRVAADDQRVADMSEDGA